MIVALKRESKGAARVHRAHPLRRNVLFAGEQNKAFVRVIFNQLTNMGDHVTRRYLAGLVTIVINEKEMKMSLDKPVKRKGFDRNAVDAVERSIGVVIDPVIPDKQKDAIEPGSESGLRRGKVKVKTPAVKSGKRTPFL